MDLPDVSYYLIKNYNNHMIMIIIRISFTGGRWDKDMIARKNKQTNRLMHWAGVFIIIGSHRNTVYRLML